MRKLLILRPEPAATATGSRAVALGLDPVICPLFTVEPVAWAPPDPSAFDALLLTSANAVRFGGPGLDALAALPVLAVGEATATAARAAGFAVTMVGAGGFAELLAALPGRRRLLHLAGEDRHRADTHHEVEALTVYRSVLLADPALPSLAGMVAMVHSPRAGQRLAELAGDRSGTAIAAISQAAAVASGRGWESLDWPGSPSDSALLALAARLCQGRRQ